jgi:parallel beta-helix repeat protein
VARQALPMITLGLALLISSVSPDHRIVVRPGQSIQAAVNLALPGDTIVVEPGKYRETGNPCPFDATQTCAVSVTKDNISLVARSGAQPVVLDNPTGLTNGIGVGKTYGCQRGSAYHTKGSRVIGFTVRGFKGSGIVLSCVDDWELAYNNTPNNVLYGIYPVYAGKGRVHDNVASGATDTGIYVGLSHDVRVDHNLVYDNVSGFEFENTVNSQLDHNTAFNNTAGILEFIIPGDPLERSRNNAINDNLVRDNNRPNKCSVPSDPVCLVPPGVGIAIAGGNNNVTLGNKVVGNKTYGIAVTDVCTAFEIPASQCGSLGFNPLPMNTRTERNTARLNGVDLLWTENGKGNCWLNNRAKTTFPTSLPQCTGQMPPFAPLRL